jgi:hypothetical protein
MKRPNKKIAAALLLVTVVVLVGYGARRQAKQDEPTEFMAWQFTQAIVKQRMIRPGNTVFPRYSLADIKKDNKNFVVKAYAHTLDSNSETVEYDFTVVIEYIGSDVFEEISVQLTRRGE